MIVKARQQRSAAAHHRQFSAAAQDGPRARVLEQFLYDAAGIMARLARDHWPPGMTSASAALEERRRRKPHINSTNNTTAAFREQAL